MTNAKNTRSLRVYTKSIKDQLKTAASEGLDERRFRDKFAMAKICRGCGQDFMLCSLIEVSACC